MALARLSFALVAGAVLFWRLPQAGLLAATQELIAFLSLLMAGLLPAMILTATILRGGGLSAKRVDEYGKALKQQLRFWAGLFAAAGIATIAIVGAKVFSTVGAGVWVDLGVLVINEERLTTAFIVLAGASVGVVISRLKPAYEGLASLLDLNVKMARNEAIVHDRTLQEAIEQQGRKPPVDNPYAMTS